MQAGADSADWVVSDSLGDLLSFLDGRTTEFADQLLIDLLEIRVSDHEVLPAIGFAETQGFARYFGEHVQDLLAGGHSALQQTDGCLELVRYRISIPKCRYQIAFVVHERQIAIAVDELTAATAVVMLLLFGREAFEVFHEQWLVVFFRVIDFNDKQLRAVKLHVLVESCLYYGVQLRERSAGLIHSNFVYSFHLQLLVYTEKIKCI
ncbi:hypothetical protein D3C85_611780 [compost metagenome]